MPSTAAIMRSRRSVLADNNWEENRPGKQTVPEEQSDADSALLTRFQPPHFHRPTPVSATGESSSRQSGPTPRKASTEASHSSGTGVILPPPSPSASAILSAGASGLPNPFARPPSPSQQNSQSYRSNNNIDTPMSALPSRFVADGLLPPPSLFYPKCNFRRSAGERNMLSSLLGLIQYLNPGNDIWVPYISTTMRSGC